MFAKIQKYLPQHFISYLAGKIAECEFGPIKNLLIYSFKNYYEVDLGPAKIQNYKEFKSFNDFFTREIRKETRPIDGTFDAMISPSDGKISNLGVTTNNMLIQAKGHEYSVDSLLTNECKSLNDLKNGSYATIYLAPKDYHRVHMPVDGVLEQMIYVPGKLFSVNEKTAANVPNLFSQNERVITIFNTDFGKIAVILVGAIIVGNIDISWIGNINSEHSKKIKTWDYSNNDRFIKLNKGDELGLFKLGSTVIILTEKELNFNIKENQDILMGKKIATKQKLIN